jgi:hypothetical protein
LPNRPPIGGCTRSAPAVTWRGIPIRSCLGLANNMRNSHDTQNCPDLKLSEAGAADHDALRHIAERVADRIADTG